MTALILLFSSAVFAAAPQCKFAAFKAANPIPPSTIKQPNNDCMNRLTHYSNYLAFGKTAANGCSDWDWADKLIKSYGVKIKTDGVGFDEIPDLDSPLDKKVSSKEAFRIKLTDSPEGFKASITSVTPTGARCALTLDIARNFRGVAATPAAPAVAKSAEKKSRAPAAVKKKNKKAHKK